MPADWKASTPIVIAAGIVAAGTSVGMSACRVGVAIALKRADNAVNP